MFDLLDHMLTELIKAAPTGVSLDDLHNAQASFVTPKQPYPLQGNAEVNLFLYETKENRDLRDPMPITRQQNSLSLRRRSPLRVDCAYMVTTWTDGATEGAKVTASHKLLGQAFNWLSRFPVIPDAYVQAGGLTGQLYAPPTMVAQMDGAKSAGEFWSALGIPPRPYFNLIVTICMDLDQSVEGSIVTTVSSRYCQMGTVAAPDELITIGGTVRDISGNPVREAWVRLESPNPAQTQTQVADANGRFLFERVAQGASYTLRARASGYHEATPRSVEVPSTMAGEYDLQLTA
ncbi:Pvc16 family protein [Candidatus Nitrospira nitrificans]|uniref:Pvc16 N-terminal domain-containing protein n=1 Tax=Candidatus Nitrospira nitrificans TaxID=1742973 RepID=A0A0S4LFV7_9BACT|nr:Pvc16 family protein [Candidatus Nitrospira nitrificans]CUS34002.1 conserved hypothetical protein [Candidatus Nitrospira nitrificans]